MFVNSQTNQSPPVAASPNPSPTIFHTSSTMGGFTVEIPPGFTVEEKMAVITIKSREGEVLILQNNTNLNNLQDYIKYSQNNLETRLKNREEKMINGLTTISGQLENERIYFIYAKNVVYLISTKTASLSLILDQIAQSFRIQ